MLARNRRQPTPRRRDRLVVPPTPRDPEATRQRWQRILAGVIVLLVGINLYAFVFGKRSLRNVYRDVTVGAGSGAGKPRADGGAPRGAAGPDRSLLNLRLPQSITSAAYKAQEEDALLEVESATVHGQIKRGDNLYRALKRVGVNRLLGDTIVRTLDTVYDFRKARPGQRFSARLSQDQRHLLAFEFEANPGELYQIHRAGTRLVGERVVKPVVKRYYEIAAPVRSTLWGAFAALGEDSRLLAAYVGIFSWDLNLYTDVGKDDVIKLIVEKQYQGDAFHRYGQVLAAEFIGQKKRVRAFWYRPPRGSGGFYDESGQALHRDVLQAPLKYKKLTSPFNPGRLHPVLKVVRPHEGVDYAAPTGTPVWAVSDGEVAFVGRNAAAGNMVVLEHEAGTKSVYMHLHKFKKGLKKGQKVRQREVIGYVGSTGMSTGPHLHFGLKVNERYVDPLKHERRRRPSIPAALTMDFRRAITPLGAALSSLEGRGGAVSRVASKDVLATVELYDRR
jgi:murein DD-endopeptidase MepM/ murein hydrolase activator NlpD